MSTYKFKIPGIPVVQQRWQIGKYGQRYDPSSRARKQLAQELLVARQTNGMPIFKNDLSLKLTFYFQAHGARKIDIDNCLKAFFDSGNGILWEDDDQICHIDAWKVKCEPGHEQTEAEIMEL